MGLVMTAPLTHYHGWRNPVRIVGAPMSMPRKVGRAVRNSRVFSRVRSLCAHCGCVNHRKFNGRPSLRAPPGSFDAKYHVYVYYYTANRRLCMGVPPYRSVSYQNCVGIAPPSKILWGRLPPLPPGSAAYDYQNVSQMTFPMYI